MNVTVTAYDACRKCCGHTHGITKSGIRAAARRTIAVDPRLIPLGSLVFIAHSDPSVRGLYRAEDTGGSIKNRKIDIFFSNHKQALEFGIDKLQIYVLKQRTSVN